MDNFQKIQVFDWIDEALEKLNYSHIKPNLVVEFSERFTRRMGDALYKYSTKEMRIRFSVPLWKHATEQQRYETVVHEICHIVDDVSSNTRTKAHGPSWKALMIKCGLKPDRCHDVKRPQELKRKVKRIAFICSESCGVKYITQHRATKMSNGAVYTCRTCGHKISLIYDRNGYLVQK